MLNFLFLTSFTAIGLGGLYCWQVSLRLWQQRQPILTPRPIIPTPFGLIDVTIMFVTWVLGQLGSTLFAGWWLQIDLSTIEKTGLNESASSANLAIMTGIVAGGQLISTVTGILIIWHRYRRWEIFGWQRKFIVPDIKLGLLAFMMVVPGILLMHRALTLLVEYHHQTLDLLSDNHAWLTIVATWFAAVLVAPIGEEIFFRGVLQAWLQRVVNPKTTIDRSISGGWDDNVSPRINQAQLMPILLSAILFALVHVGQGLAAIPLFVLALPLGYLYQRTGSLLPCIVLHAGLNGFTMFWMTLPMLLPTS